MSVHLIDRGRGFPIGSAAPSTRAHFNTSCSMLRKYVLRRIVSRQRSWTKTCTGAMSGRISSSWGQNDPPRTSSLHSFGELLTTLMPLPHRNFPSETSVSGRCNSPHLRARNIYTHLNDCVQNQGGTISIVSQSCIANAQTSQQHVSTIIIIITSHPRH